MKDDKCILDFFLATFKFLNTELNYKCYRIFLRPNHPHSPCPRHISIFLVYSLFLAGILQTVCQIFVHSCNEIVQEDKDVQEVPLDDLNMKIVESDCTQTHIDKCDK